MERKIDESYGGTGTIIRNDIEFALSDDRCDLMTYRYPLDESNVNSSFSMIFMYGILLPQEELMSMIGNTVHLVSNMERSVDFLFQKRG